MNKNQQQQTAKLEKHVSHKNRWVIGFIVFLLLVGVVVGAWVFVTRQNKSTQTQTSSQTQTSQQDQPLSPETSKTISQAQVLASNGNVDAATTAYDTAIKDTKDDGQKSILYSQKATLLFNKGAYDEALAAALQAESARKDASIEAFIAQIYEKKGDTQRAIVYYKKAILIVDKTQPLADSDIQYYKNTVLRLGGAVN